MSPEEQAVAVTVEKYLRGTGVWRPLVRGPLHGRFMTEMARAVLAALDHPARLPAARPEEDA